MYDRVVSEDPFLIVCCPNKYKNQGMCDEAVDDRLEALKFIPDWLVTSKMIKNLLTALYAYDNIVYFKDDSGNVVFSGIEILIILILMILIMMKMILKLLFMSNLWLDILNLKNTKHLKKHK